jgi:hypothetical protein
MIEFYDENKAPTVEEAYECLEGTRISKLMMKNPNFKRQYTEKFTNRNADR